MNSNVYTAMHCTCPVPAPGCILVQLSRTLLSGSMLMTLSNEQRNMIRNNSLKHFQFIHSQSNTLHLLFITNLL